MGISSGTPQARQRGSELGGSDDGEFEFFQEFFEVVFVCWIAVWLVNGENLLQRLSHDFNCLRVHGGDDTGFTFNVTPAKVSPFGDQLRQHWFLAKRAAIRADGRKTSAIKAVRNAGIAVAL